MRSGTTAFLIPHASLLEAPRLLRPGDALQAVLGNLEAHDDTVRGVDEVGGDVVLVVAEEALLDPEAGHPATVVGRHLGDAADIAVVIVDDERPFREDDRARVPLFDLA